MEDIEKELDLIWGAEAIARAIRREPGMVWHMLQRGDILGARKIRGRWVISRHKLREAFGLEAA